MKKPVIALTSIVYLFFFLGCTTAYKPGGPGEQSAYDHARRDITLSQFKTSPEKFSGEIVAWTGVLKKIEVTEDSKVNRGLWIKFFIDQRPFSWIWTTRSGLPAGYLVSSKGEGLFEGLLKLQFTNTDKPLDEIKKEFQDEYGPGCFVIIYGRPELRTNGNLDMRILFARSIPSSQWFTEQTDF